MLTLPKDLHDAIERALATSHPSRWTRDAQALSERYRAEQRAPDRPLVANANEALGYAALILPATYAQLAGAMSAAAARTPGWQPQTMLDLGSGPGTALWAALALWPSLHALTAWEREPAFIRLGRELAGGAQHAALRAARWERHDLRRPPDDDTRYDLVVLGHVLNELDDEAQAAVLDAAWARTAGMLLIVEPGTAAAFAVARAARDRLLAAGARTIAPCAHDRPCPLENDWCHFPQRLRRPEFQRRARGAPSEWEDAKFAYAAMARFGPERPIWGRVIREPSFNKAYSETTISATDGVSRYRALKRHREAFRFVKDLAWGQPLDDRPEGEIEEIP